ncbi:MAG: hypothetical protein P9M02_02760 [Candidatus Susulua stagnicola]|nr:hypothetical protein [Candidatus Susulua stagnicola]
MLIFIVLGIITSIFQLTIFREFTYSLAKNELSLMLGVGIWLVSCSLGSFLFKKKKTLAPVTISVLFALIYSLVIFAVHWIKSFFGLSYYESVSLGFVIIAAICLISPVGFLIGYSFRVFSQNYLEKHSPKVRTFAKFFAYEASGFFIGGIAFTFLFSSYSNPFIFTVFSCLLLLVLNCEARKKIISFLVIILIAIVFFFSFKPILKFELKGANILKFEGSNYGPVILAKKFDVESLYINGSLVSTSEDKAENEQFIHSVLAANPKAKNILFIGSYFSGQIQEILKYPIEELDCVNINPAISSLSINKLRASQRERVNFIITDPRSYLNKNRKKYDCIIMNIPAPLSIAFNRYYSYQFFQLVKEHLNSQGIFSFRIPSKTDILSPQFIRFNSCIINTIDSVFKSRLLIPSDSMIIISSLGKKNSPGNLIENFKSLNISTDYFTIYHLRDSLDPSRITYIEKMLDRRVDLNSDFNLLGFLYYSLVEQAKFYPQISIDISMVRNIVVIIFILLVIFASGLGFSKRRPLSLFNASVVGFSSIGLSIIIFVLFQIYSGALIQKMGILVGVFMAGLSLGTYLVNLISQKISKIRWSLSFLYLLWFVFLIGFWVGIKSFENYYQIDFVFYLGSLLSGMLTGAVYPILSGFVFNHKINFKDLAPSIYMADLAGAAIGTFVFSIFFIPFLGVGLSLLMIMFLVFIWGLREFI